MEDLYRSDLAYKGPQLIHLLIIYKLAYFYFKSRHIEEADTDLITEFA